MRETFSAAAAVFLEWQRKKKAKRLKFLGLALNLMSCLQQCIIISGTASTSQVQFSAPGSGLWLPVVLWGSWSLAVRAPSEASLLLLGWAHTCHWDVSSALWYSWGAVYFFIFVSSSPVGESLCPQCYSKTVVPKQMLLFCEKVKNERCYITIKLYAYSSHFILDRVILTNKGHFAW